jgi:hypothetical protein
MTQAQALGWVRAIHTAIYLVMASASSAALYAGVTGAHGAWLWLAGGLVAVETVVFTASGLRCPLTALAARYGAARRGVPDTFLPEPMTRHTFHVFAPLILVLTVLLAARAWWFGWT